VQTFSGNSRTSTLWICSRGYARKQINKNLTSSGRNLMN
jgi:hypothetical protein